MIFNMDCGEVIDACHNKKLWCQWPINLSQFVIFFLAMAMARSPLRMALSSVILKFMARASKIIYNKALFLSICNGAQLCTGRTGG